MKKVREITNILDKIYNLYPNTKIELNYKTPFQLLISVILSAQNTDKQVNKVTEAFFEIIKNPEDILNLKITEIEKYLKSLNYYKHKTKYIKLSGEKLYK
ncbi:endonuclease III, partial [Candidatus Gracilibacteria bacterium]|nr:endonuclease III [Candidatus Gracilibacteria bacterium]